MEHQRCYIYQPSELEERAPKRQRTSSSNPQVHLSERLQTYRELWAQQEQQIQVAATPTGF
jgi:origin recognition complex subunit 3